MVRRSLQVDLNLQCGAELMTASNGGGKLILLDVCFLSFLLSQQPPIKPDCHFDSRNL